MKNSMSRSRAATRKKWAIYTYIAGDNNLSNEGLIDITEMEDAGSSIDTHVAVQIDTAGVHDGSIRYEISEPDFEGHSHRIEIQRLPEQNTGEPKHLAKFATWAGSRYPASKKLLVVWNHGAGFMHEPTRDIGYDDSSDGDALTMGELRWALTKAGFGAPPKGKISILGFDACLMNMLEVAYEFIGVADMVVGSQQTEPGEGWPYHDVIRGLTGDSRAVARNIVAKYIAHYRAAGTRGVTQSAVELRKLAPLGTAVNRLGKELRQRLPGAKSAILQARLNTQGYEEPTYVDRGPDRKAEGEDARRDHGGGLRRGHSCREERRLRRRLLWNLREPLSRTVDLVSRDQLGLRREARRVRRAALLGQVQGVAPFPGCDAGGLRGSHVRSVVFTTVTTETHGA